MIKYSRYLLSYIFRKKAIYLIPLVLFTSFNFSIYFQIDSTNEYGLAFINSMSTFNKFMPFICMGAFSSLIVIYAFKETELDGSDLLILSKPISRYKMILSKFLVTYFVIFVYAFATGINFTLIALLDSVAWKNDHLAPLKFGGSLALGSFIVAIFITSLTIIISTRLGKTGILNFSGTIVPVIPILSFIVSAATGGIPTEVEFMRRPTHRIPAKDINLSTIPTNQKEIARFLNENQNTDTYYFLNEKEVKDDFDRFKEDRRYDYISYFDVWYQWQRFFSIFIQEDRVTRTVIKDFDDPTIKINKLNDDEPIKIGNEEYIFFANSWDIARVVSTLSKYNFQDEDGQERLTKLIGDINWIRDYLANRNNFSFMEVASALEFIVDDNKNGGLSLDEHETTFASETDVEKRKEATWKDRILSKSSSPSSLGIILYQFLSSDNAIVESDAPPMIRGISSIIQQNKIKRANKLFQDDDKEDYKIKVKNYLVKNGDSVVIAKARDFISTNYILIFWGVFTTLMIIAAFYSYFRRDFK